MKKRQIILSIALAGLMSVSTVFGSIGQLKSTTLSKPEAKVSQTATKQKRNVMYYGDWSIWEGEDNCYPADLPANLYTHLNFAFMDFNSNGDLILCDNDAAGEAELGQKGVSWGDINAGLFPAFQNLKAKNPNLKFGLSLGGWSKSNDFATVCANDATRAKFIKNIMAFLKYTNMDFVDIDWEYPGFYREPDTVDIAADEGTVHSSPADKANYVKLMQDLRVALDKQGTELGKKYELSAALSMSAEKIEQGIDIEKLFKVLDFGNIMTYDATGSWDTMSGHHTALYGNPKDPNYAKGWSVDQSVKYYKEHGAPADKLVVGSAFYSRGWGKVDAVGTDPNLPGLFAKASIAGKDADGQESYGALNDTQLKVGDAGRRSGSWAYRNHDKLRAAYPGITEYWDDVAKAPYMYDSKTGNMFTYDNVRSITEKAKYVNDNELGGMISWMASNDKKTTSNVRDELTKAQAKGLYGDKALPAQEIVEAPLDLKVTIKTYKGQYGSQGYTITLKNNEKLVETDKAVRLVETKHKTIMLPKLYINNSGLALSEGSDAGGMGVISNLNGQTIVDLGDDYENRFIAPGQTKTFKLQQDGALDVKNLKSISISQRVSLDGVEMEKQNLFGDSEIVENTAPVLNGVADKSIIKGTAFDVRDNVTAFDKEDGDLTANIIVQHNLNNQKIGNYTVTYTVVDSKGVTTTATRVISVVENTAPTFSGNTAITIEVGTKFDEMAGVTAYDKESGDLTSLIKIVGKNVDLSKPGDYYIEYSVTDGSHIVNTMRSIRVVPKTIIETNTAPTISGATNKEIKVGDSFDPKAGVTAFDKEDGDLTSSIKIATNLNTNKEGTYGVTYGVTDSKGVTTTKDIIVKVLPKTIIETNTAPTISGATNKEIKVGTKFDAKASVTAFDKEDGDLTSAIVISGNVDTTKAGTYTVTYTVTDSKGLKATKTITITVTKAAEPSKYPEWNRNDEAAGKYVPGFKVTYKGVVYVQSTSSTVWWAEPSANSTVWKSEGADDGYIKPAIKEWSLTDQAAGLYTPGVKVTYNGVTYIQSSTSTAWWAEPSATSSIWKVVK